MGYMHIDNLYNNGKVLEFEELFATEKIHGTSAHIWYKKGQPIGFFSGGAKMEQFVSIFNGSELQTLLDAMGQESVVVYGEAYGGKMQAMSHTYGPDLKFVAFDVKMNGDWLDVPTAEQLVKYLKLEFVDYKRIPATLSAIDAERDRDSTQAIRNGMGPGHIREGVVLRPIKECVDERGNRIMAKHKRAEFRENQSVKVVDPEELKRKAEANKVAEEWATPMRLQHVLDQAMSLMNAVKGLEEGRRDLDITDTGNIIKMMIEDIRKECEGEVDVDDKTIGNAIGRTTALLFKKHLAEQFMEKYKGAA